MAPGCTVTRRCCSIERRPRWYGLAEFRTKKKSEIKGPSRPFMNLPSHRQPLGSRPPRELFVWRSFTKTTALICNGYVGCLHPVLWLTSPFLLVLPIS
jgi:hypothetical protein